VLASDERSPSRSQQLSTNQRPTERSKARMKKQPATTLTVGLTTSIDVPILQRAWPLWAGPRPRKINGESPVIRPVIEHLRKPTFAEVRVAEELGEAGASWWCWIDTFNRGYRRAIYGEAPAVQPPHEVLNLLSRIWVENGGTLYGAWDAFAVAADGRLVFREVKRRGKDKLNQHQHRFAEAVLRAYPDADLAVVEWTAEVQQP
jgi:hypothetical protein